MAKRVYAFVLRGSVDLESLEPVPSDGSVLSTEMLRVLASRYWPSDQVANAVAIALCESGGRTDAHNTSGEDSRGLWQINVATGAHPELAALDLFDADVNAAHAYAIWHTAGGSWHPWLNCARSLGLV